MEGSDFSLTNAEVPRAIELASRERRPVAVPEHLAQAGICGQRRNRPRRRLRVHQQITHVETVEDGDGNVICAHVECPACLARGPQEQIVQNAIDFWNECEAPPVAAGERKHG